MSAIHGSRKDTAEPAPQVRTEAVGLLAAGLAHDLNNMLAGIVATAELVADRHHGSVQDSADLSAIVDQAVRASRLIRQVLAFSRQEMLKPAVADPGRLVADLAPVLKALAAPAVRVDFAAGQPVQVLVDTTAFERILVNLVVNARDAILEQQGREKGRIRITSGRLGAGELPLGASGFMPAGCYGFVAVEDDGPGISEDVAARIFEPYFTTRAKGQGLGLSSAYGLVKQSGGFLLHDRAPLGGARFGVYLPITQEAREQRPVSRRGSGTTIVLAEDEMLLRMSAARGLERIGFRVRQAADGEAALARLEAERPALLISDIRMPGMDGVELARQARARHPGLPVLLVSGYADQTARDAVPGLGVGFLEKPFTMKRLEEEVEALL